MNTSHHHGDHPPITRKNDSTPRRILITSHCVLNQNEQEGYGIYQLPVPTHQVLDASIASDGERAEWRQEDREQLDFVFSRLAVYLANGYEVVGAVFAREDAEDADELDWLDSVEWAARRHQVPLAPILAVPVAAVAVRPESQFHPHLLEVIP